MIYLLVRCSGEYEDYREKTMWYHHDRSVLESLLKKLNKELQKAKKEIDALQSKITTLGGHMSDDPRVDKYRDKLDTVKMKSDPELGVYDFYDAAYRIDDVDLYKDGNNE